MNAVRSPHANTHSTKMTTPFQSPHRKSIRQKSTTPSSSSSPWRDNLKAKCLERAREKRRNTMMKKRSPGLTYTAKINSTNGNVNSSSPFLCTPHQNMNHIMDHINETQEQNHHQPMDEARKLIEEQLQETGTRVLYSNKSELRIKNPNSFMVSSPFSTPTKQYKGSHNLQNNMNIDGNGNSSNNRIAFHFSPAPKSLLLNNNNNHSNNENGSILSTMPQFPPPPYTPLSASKCMSYHDQNINNSNNENWISEEELYELMQEIEEEIQMEQETHLQNEIDAMEIQEERYSNYIQEQIDMFEKNETNINSSSTMVSMTASINNNYDADTMMK